MFDTMLNIMSVNTNAPTTEEIDQGANPEVIVTLTPGLMLPIADPSDPTHPVVVPGGNIRFRLDGESAVSIGRKLVEEGERMPKRSRIEVASSLSGAEGAARRLAELKG